MLDEIESLLEGANLSCRYPEMIKRHKTPFSEKKVSDCAVDLSDIMGMNTSVIAG